MENVKVLCPICGGATQVAVTQVAFDYCWFCDGTGLVNKDSKTEQQPEPEVEDIKIESDVEIVVEEVAKPKTKKKKKEEAKDGE